MTDVKTIDPAHAADLYALLNRDGVIDPDPPATHTAHGWTALGTQAAGYRRCHHDYLLVLRDPDGAVWGIPYALGVTEEQEHDMPWRDASGPIGLVRLHRHETTRVEYRTEPAEHGRTLTADATEASA